MKTIRSEQLKESLVRDPGQQLIDVREPDEFLGCHLPGSRCIPLSTLGQRLGDIDLSREVTVICQSGGRAGQAASQLEEFGGASVGVLEGGVSAWRECGLPVRSIRRTISIQRQVMIGAGAVVLVGFVSGLWNSWFHVLSAFAGTMLIVAGLTGFCFMAKALARMPWNQVNVAGNKSKGCEAQGAICHEA